MPLSRKIQPSFAKGVVSPALYGRVDTAAYQVALRKAENCIIHPYGGVSNRAGTTFIGPVKDHTNGARLIPFKFSTSDTYILEFGNLYMRVIRDNGHVLEAAVTITGATAANPVVVTAVAHGYSNGDEVYITGVVGMTELNGRRFTVANVAANTMELTDQVTGGNIDGSAYTAYSSAGTVARVYTLTTPYAVGDLNQLKYVQSADTMTLVHPTYPVQSLTRTDHDAWTIGDLAFNPTQDHPTGQGVTATTGTGTTTYYRVTAIAEDGEESLSALNSDTKTITGATAANPVVITSASHGLSAGDEIEINGIVGMTELNGRRFLLGAVAANTMDLQDIEGNDLDGSAYTAYSSGGTANLTYDSVSGGATKNNVITWTAVTGAVKYAVYHRNNGLYGLIGETELTTFTDNNISADTSLSPPRYVEVFQEAGDYPSAVGYFEQRRVFGGSTNEPDTSRFSVTGNHSNFSKSIPTQADDSITATLAANEVNAIRHYVPGNDLLVLTSGSEWRINAGADSGFEAATLKQKPQSYWGSSHRPPLPIGVAVLFLQENKSVVRSIGYSLQIDGYTGSNIGLLAEHLLRNNTVEEWAHSRAPDPIIYMVRDDGQLLCLTFDQEQEVVAWTNWTTDGNFESVASGIRPNSTAVDEPAYFVVKRTINGNTVRYIEYSHTRNFTDVRDCFFVDSGLSLDSPVTITGITAANPVVVTAASHGFSDGDEVDLFDIIWTPDTDTYDGKTQPDQLNRRRYTVANKTADTFGLTDSDGAAIDGSAFNAYVSGGTARLAVSSVSGLRHLAGESVDVLADGNVISGSTVSSEGVLTLSRKFSRIHVGLPYIADIQTLDLEDPRAGGTVQGRTKKLTKVTVRLERSRGMLYGHTFTNMDEAKWREDEAMGDPTALLTGDKSVDFPPDWTVHGRMCFRQRDPLPITILALAPEYDVGD